MIFTKLRRRIEGREGSNHAKENSKAIMQLKERIDELEEKIDG